MREAARWICLTACPVLEQCRAWALSQPTYASGGLVLAGMTNTARAAERRRLAEAEAA